MHQLELIPLDDPDDKPRPKLDLDEETIVQLVGLMGLAILALLRQQREADDER